VSLVRLMYVSSAVAELADAALRSILESAVRHNTPVGVTGMLLYCGGNFMQVLEGEEPTVRETYERICQDPRHKDLYLLGLAAIGARDFAAWSMGFRQLAAADAVQHPAYAPFLGNGFGAFRIDARPGLALEMLQRFSRLQR
jgi:hypothetical protein